MMKCEFEMLAMRNNAEIGAILYECIERFYTSDNNYHAAYGGLYETKQEFVKRVFGGKVNTLKTITEKLTAEAIKENRYALQWHNVSNDRLDKMDMLITEHYNTIMLKGW